MNFLKLSEAPNRLSPEQLSEKTDSLLNSLKSAITYLNLVKSAIVPLSTVKSKYRAGTATALYTTNPANYDLSDLLVSSSSSSSFKSNILSDGFNVASYTSNPFGTRYPSVFTTYYVIRIAPPLGTYQSYIGAFKTSTNTARYYSVNTHYSTVFATGSSHIWGFYLTAPPTTLAVWPAAIATTNIVDSPDTAFGTYGQVCAQRSTNNLYFFARTRWKRAVLETY